MLLFSDITKDTLDLIAELNRKKQHTFLMPTRFIAPEAGQVGYLLNEYFNWNRARTDRVCYRTFFANAKFEAIQIAIKISRHNASIRYPEHTKNILLYDPSLKYQHFINPLKRNTSKVLLPGITTAFSKSDLHAKLTKSDAYLAIIISNTEHLQAKELVDLLCACKNKNIITTVVYTPLLQTIAPLPDIIITDESLTNYEIPYGGVSISETIHKPWATMQGCLMQTSTYAGNRLVLNKIRNLLLAMPCFQNEPRVQRKCIQIQQKNRRRLQAFAKYVNPGLVQLYKSTGLDINPSIAYGSKLIINNREVIDCVAGGGAVIRGHAPTDIISDVIAKHSNARNYWQEMQKLFASFTNFDHIFPAVSGATAVDIAISLALLAKSEKTKIVVFKDNYAGKNLLSLIGSADPMWSAPFGPLYNDVIYVDAFAASADTTLSSILAKGDVALVWFEMIQGANAKEIPRPVIDVINKYRSTYNYLVGIDEILMGTGRSGSFFTYTGKIVPDIITLSKSLSDGTFPVAATLTTSKVYQQAKQTNAAAVNHYSNLYRNQFGAHIALHCIKKLRALDIVTHVNKVTKFLDKGFANIARRSSLVKEIVGNGLFYKLNYYNAKNFMYILFLSRCCLQKGIFIFLDRLIPALTLSEKEAVYLLEKLDEILCKSSLRIQIKFFLFMLKIRFLTLANKICHILKK